MITRSEATSLVRRALRQLGRRKDGLDMTLINVAFRYGTHPTEAQTRAMARVRDVYGVWRMTLNGKERTLRIEYDASRLSECGVASLLRSAGIDLLGKLAVP